MVIDNYRYLSLLMKRLYGVLLVVILMTTASSIFFAWQWYRASSLDNVYLLSSDHTLVAGRTDGSLARSEQEIRAFVGVFLEKAFAHHEYNYEENLEKVTSWMDHSSARIFLSKMDSVIKSLYKEHNAISTVQVEDIEFSKSKRPYELLVYYKTKLEFSAAGDNVYDKMDTDGGIYLQIVPMLRSNSNPFGMQVRGLKFINGKQ